MAHHGLRRVTRGLTGRLLTSPRWGEVDSRRRRGSGEGVTTYSTKARSPSPHPSPLRGEGINCGAVRTTNSAAALERGAPGEHCLWAELLLDPDELVVFRRA